MPLPELNAEGDLPPGIHTATLEEVDARFGGDSPERLAATACLKKVHRLAHATGCVSRFVVFGSYVTSKPRPNDVDIVLVMQDNFRPHMCDDEMRNLLDHREAQEEFGASVFWIRPAHLIAETVDDFLAYWQTNRDQGQRGIVEVIA